MFVLDVLMVNMKKFEHKIYCDQCGFFLAKVTDPKDPLLLITENYCYRCFVKLKPKKQQMRN